MMVKICGITRADDAVLAVESGAAAVGFIFWPGSPRVVSASAAATVVKTLPSAVMKVGVFVNQTRAEIEAIVHEAGLTAVQLHGDETPEFAAALQLPVIKAVSQVTPDLDRWPAHVTLLVDAYDPIRRGGTGATADWRQAAALAHHRRVMLAGGLNAGNVASAIATVQPFGIDVSSGVESSPGIKDPQKIRALFQALQVS